MNKMNLKILVAAAFMLLSGCAYMNAQVTVGANTAPNATLDVVAAHTDGTTPEGVIAPRLTLAQLKAADGVYSTAQNGAIVYVTDVAGGTTTKTANITAAGYYYYDAVNAVWKGLGGGFTSEYKHIPSLASIISVQASELTAMETVFLCTGPISGKIELPDLTLADKGKKVYVSHHLNMGGNVIVNFKQANEADGTDTAPLHREYTITSKSGQGFYWAGEFWFVIGK